LPNNAIVPVSVHPMSTADITPPHPSLPVDELNMLSFNGNSSLHSGLEFDDDYDNDDMLTNN
jgi:hypothetical protein